MNEFEENKYLEIKEELLQSIIDTELDIYFIKHNEQKHYYNVGKMIVDAQGGEIQTEDGDKLIRKIARRLTKELGKRYDYSSLTLMKKLYLIKKEQAAHAQSQKKEHPDD